MGLCFVSVMFNVSTLAYGRLCQLLSVARVQVDKKHTWYTVSACVKFYRSYLFSIDESGPSAAVGEAQLCLSRVSLPHCKQQWVYIGFFRK